MGPRVLYQKEASSASNVEVEQNCLQGNCSQPVSPARLGRVRVRRAHTLDLRSSRHCDLCKAYGALYSIIKYRAVCTALYGSFVKYCLYILNPEFNYNRKGSCGIMWNVKRPLQGVNFRSTQLKHETWFTNLLAADQAARTQNEYENSIPLSCASIRIFLGSPVSRGVWRVARLTSRGDAT